MPHPALRLLILGGTAEARELASALHGRPGLAVTSSLAGRLSDPRLPVGDVRVGGFSGVDGLTEYLRAEGVDVVVDATHPFAATISSHAAEACHLAGCHLIALRRPGWTQTAADHWIRVPDLPSAAAWVAERPPGVIFLTTGRRDLSHFAADGEHHYLIRSVEQPDPPLPPRNTVLLARGPFSLEGELALMRDYSVALLVTKDTGGAMTEAKLRAARELAIPVLLVDRPSPPPARLVAQTVAEALSLLETLEAEG